MPLCAIHHHNIHTTGKEREWRHERNIDPLEVANALWQKSRERYLAAREDFPESRKKKSADARPKGGHATDYDSKRGVTASTDNALDGAETRLRAKSSARPPAKI